MSKYLVAFYNNTDETILFRNLECAANNRTLSPQSMFTTKVHFNIPDNSDSSRYFDEHHMELQREDGTPIFSFWDDDDAKYVMYYCKTRDWRSALSMPGHNPSGDRIDIAIVLTGSSTDYELYACDVQALV
jgi:hypothetical protein